MQPSSLIFVVVVAIWAVYLVQHWIRRREHMATARSVDRFSEAMRVLERRGVADAAGRTADPAGGQHGAGADRGGRPAVREAGSASGRRSPLVARATMAPTRSSEPAQPLGRRPVRRRSPMARRVRGIGVLGAVAVVPLTAVLTMLGVVPWWTIVIAMGEVALCLVALRLAAVREQTARHTERSMRRTAAPREIDPPALPAEPETPADDAADSAAAPPAYRPGDPTWNPVPVPRPTYQLKEPAPAPRPEPVPAPVLEEAGEPAPQPRRRAVGG